MAAEDDIDIVVYEQFFKNSTNGIIVEVGAADPEYLSISAHFRKAGWKVIAIEPNPEFCAKHQAKGYEVLEYAVSDTEGDDVDFFVVDSKGFEYLGGQVTSESFSSLGIPEEFNELYSRIEETSETKKISVKMRKLDTILATHEPDVKQIDLMAVDVEGWELSVLKGFSLGEYNPKVIILENLFDKDDCELHLTDNGYVKWMKLGFNEIFIQKEMSDARSRAAAAKFTALHKASKLSGRVTKKLKQIIGGGA